jgi:hypothetical protein
MQRKSNRVHALLSVAIVCSMAGPDALCAQAGTPGIRSEAAMEAMKRRVPKPAPVSHRGIRYEVLLNGKARGFGHNGGIIKATDEAQNAELWTLIVYRVDITPDGEEPDAQEVFITKLSLKSGGKQLIVDNQRKERFLVDLADRTVTGPAGRAP